MRNRCALHAGNAALALAWAAVLTAGCTAPASIIPPAATPPHFQQMLDGTVTGYAIVQKPLTGRGTHVFTIPARNQYTVWLGCLGNGGVADIESPQLDPPGGWGMPCNTTGTVAGLEFNLARAHAQREVTLRVTAPPHAKWEIRIDATADSTQ
jgi:hypothetical protein